jgi:hypothetical protein
MTPADRHWLVDEIDADRESALDCGEDPRQSADEWFAMLRWRLENCELAEAEKDWHTATIFKDVPAHKRARWLARNREDIERLRRLLADPELLVLLVDLEDREIFGETVRQHGRRRRAEMN